MDSNGGASPGPQDHDMNESLGDLNEFLMRDAHVMTSLVERNRRLFTHIIVQ